MVRNKDLKWHAVVRNSDPGKRAHCKTTHVSLVEPNGREQILVHSYDAVVGKIHKRGGTYFPLKVPLKI